MKIAIISSTFPPYAGGIGNVAAANARELAKLGNQVTVFTPAYDKVQEEMTDIKVTRMPVFLAYGNAAWCPSLSWMLKGFDIIHLHYPFFGGAETIWLHKRKYKKKGAKIIVHYHMDVVGEGVFRFIFSLHRKIMLPKILKMADRVIVTSNDYAKNSYLKHNLDSSKDKFFELPNGVDVENFVNTQKSKEILVKHEIDQDEKIILFVGGLDKAHYFKGIEYLIKAMTNLRQSEYLWKVIIVGEGDLKDEYKSLASQLRLDHKIVFTGYVANSDLPKYYNLADVVVLPSVDKSEAFGMALVEAMSCSKPVIASDLPGVRSVVDDKINGLLIKPKDPDDLATKINYLLSNSGVAKEFGLAGRQKVITQYSWKIIGKNLEAIYKNLKN